jgi:photosystem II stability/assembly factor-like uncharacterized protein
MSTTSQLSNYVSCLGNNDAVITGTNYQLDMSFNTANTAVSLLSAQIVISKTYPMPSVATGNGFSITGWFFPYGKTQKSNALLVEMDTSSNPTAVYLTGGNSFSLNAVYNGVVVTTNSDISAGMVLPQTWNYFCYTVECSGNTVGTAKAVQSLYLNGSSNPVVNATASYVSTPFTVTYMGKGIVYTNQFQGKLAEMRSFQRVLNPMETSILSACNNTGSAGALTLIPNLRLSGISSYSSSMSPYTITNSIFLSTTSVFNSITVNRTPVFATGPSTITVLGSSLQHVNGNWVWNDVSVNPLTSYTYVMVPILGNGTASSGIITTVQSSRRMTDPSYNTYLSYDVSNLNVVIVAPNPVYNCITYGAGLSKFMVSWSGGTGNGVTYSYVLSNGTIADISGTNPTQITITSQLVVTTTVTVTATNVLGSMSCVSNYISTTSKLGPAGLIAAGSNGAIYRSTDNGYTWTRIDTNMPSLTNNSQLMCGLFYINNMYIAVGGYNGYCIMTSTDAVTWTGVGPYGGGGVLGTYPNTFSYANGIFFASRVNGSQQFYTSTDLVNWTSAGAVVPSTSTAFGQSISYLIYNSVLGMYIATCSNNAYNNIGYSYNGTTWVTSTITGGPGGSRLAYRPSDGLTVVSGCWNNGGVFTQTYISTDGKNWTNGASPFGSNNNAQGFTLTYGNGIFMVGGNAYSIATSTYSLYTSTDGKTWTGSLLSSLLPTTNMITYIAGNNTWYAQGSNSYIYFSSNNGATWTVSTTSFGNNNWGLVW